MDHPFTTNVPRRACDNGLAPGFSLIEIRPCPGPVASYRTSETMPPFPFLSSYFRENDSPLLM
ncbi:hypothetical protein J6590_034768 [Homalodisca vitripennis]|nr:hypothetical protein J6590_034768 [Homalodisca vitripennis]